MTLDERCEEILRLIDAAIEPVGDEQMGTRQTGAGHHKTPVVPTARNRRGPSLRSTSWER